MLITAHKESTGVVSNKVGYIGISHAYYMRAWPTPEEDIMIEAGRQCLFKQYSGDNLVSAFFLLLRAFL